MASLRISTTLLLVLPLTACSARPAPQPDASRAYRGERIANPGRDAALLDFGHHQRIRLPEEGTPTTVELSLQPDFLRAADVSTLRLARYDAESRRYEPGPEIAWPEGTRGRVTLERSGDYSIVGLPADPLAKAAIGSLCAIGFEPSPAQVDPICTQILCTAFRELGDPGAFGGGVPGGGDVCERCMKTGTRGAALGECLLRPEPGPSVVPGSKQPRPVPACTTTQSLVVDPSMPGSYAVGSTSYHFVDAITLPTKPNVDVWATVRYPATTAGANTPAASGSFPLVVYLHGNHGIYVSGTEHLCSPATSTPVPNHEGYNYVLERLASLGFVAVSINANDLNCDSDEIAQRGQLILEHLRRWRDWNDPNVADVTFNGRFRNRVDMNRVGLAGHSRGGEAVISAARENQRLSLGYGIKAIHAIAPTDFYEPTLVDIPYYVILPAADGDVGGLHGLRTYDRAAPRTDPARMTKMQSHVYGANHNWFNSVWTHDDGRGLIRISAADQRAFERVYATAFFRWQLQGHSTAAGLFNGTARVATSVVNAAAYRSFQDPMHKVVDDVEDDPRDPAANTLGGVNTNASLVPFGEYSFTRFVPPVFNSSFYHETDGFIVGWNAATDEFTLSVPAAHKDASAYSYLSFRVAQVFDRGATNPAGGVQDMDIGLEDELGRTAFYRVGSQDTIPYPYERPTNTKTVLQTIRVPMSCFSNAFVNVDRAAIARVHFRFNRTSAGLQALDAIQFSR